MTLSRVDGLPNHLWLSCALALSLLTSPGAAGAEELSFGYFRGSTFTLAKAQDNVAEMNALAAEGQEEQPTNTPCIGLRYTLAGPPKEYDLSLPKYIYAPDHLAAFGNSPYKIHIVSSIKYCEQWNVRVPACHFGGSVFISQEYVTDSRAPLIYLHEVGHLRGLDQGRNPDHVYSDWHNPSFRNFMYYMIAENRRGKLKYQCEALKGGNGRFFVAQAQATEAEKLSLEDFVGGLWLHGLPAAEVQKLTEEDLSQVRKWMAHDANKFWPNSVTILGLRGNNADIELLQKALNSKTESAFAKTAKLNVPQALGYFAYRTKSNTAFELLRELMSPHQNTKFLSGAAIGDEDATILALEATQGMAVFAATGNEQALKLLTEQMQKNERGAIKLGVGPGFFKQTEKLKESVQSKGLIEGLQLKNEGLRQKN